LRIDGYKEMNEMNEQWKPTKELIEWAKEHFAQMSVGGLWMPEGSGLTYIKETENKWRLQSMIESDEVRENHDRMKTLMWDAGVTVLDDDVAILPLPETAEEAYLQEVTMKREVAKGWADKDGTLLMDMGLENLWPEYIENREILLDDGETKSIEIWGYKALNPNTGEQIVIDPDDYHLLMGDRYFMRFRAKERCYIALSREEMVAYLDAGKIGVGVGSSINEVRVPPWLWGTYCEESRDEEE
jgi:hypothetical protein